MFYSDKISGYIKNFLGREKALLAKLLRSSGFQTLQIWDWDFRLDGHAHVCVWVAVGRTEECLGLEAMRTCLLKKWFMTT